MGLFGKCGDGIWQWNQVGTDDTTYTSWVESEQLLKAKARLLDLMELVPIPDYSPIKDTGEGNDGEFECTLLYEFDPSDQISHHRQSQIIKGVYGICDWIGTGLRSTSGIEVDVLELKFCSELGNAHRIQLLIYCALLCLKKEKDCAGLLYNARTCEMEVCQMEFQKAKEFLLDISHFKLNGTHRKSGKTNPVGVKRPVERTWQFSSIERYYEAPTGTIEKNAAVPVQKVI
eukprot:CAMPEP_0117773320 /NCGR_PEP_ID=MMETSP0947-20121206/25770_1 /TAXON_ID=44440 /ORGANISM="Chattonella subsalsa, Strain CCMP2191" /LENGTH=230 /DNA_ID=CAMNT_0005599409 /DNA_START=292 /DNA_END=983 /DNA_ORIENTATION=+